MVVVVVGCFFFFNPHNQNILSVFSHGGKHPCTDQTGIKILDLKRIDEGTACLRELRVRGLGGRPQSSCFYPESRHGQQNLYRHVAQRDSCSGRCWKDRERKCSASCTFCLGRGSSYDTWPSPPRKEAFFFFFLLQGLHLCFMRIYECCQNPTPMLLIWSFLGQLFLYRYLEIQEMLEYQMRATDFLTHARTHTLFHIDRKFMKDVEVTSTSHFRSANDYVTV